MNHNRGRGQSRNYIVPHKHFSCNSLPLKNDFNTLLSEKNDELQPLDFIEKNEIISPIIQRINQYTLFVPSPSDEHIYSFLS